MEYRGSRPILAALVLVAVVGTTVSAGENWAAEWTGTLGDANRAWRDGDVETAETLFVAALEQARSLGPGSLRHARSADELAYFYLAAGRYEDAETLYRETIPLWKDLLGPDQPRLATSLHNLGAVCLHLKRYDEAESTLAEAIRIWEASLGAEHSQTGRTLQAYASALRGKGDVEGAEAAERRARAILRSEG